MRYVRERHLSQRAPEPEGTFDHRALAPSSGVVTAARSPRSRAPLEAWLKENAAETLGAALGSSEDRVMGDASTAWMYLMPPVTKHVTAADLLRDP